MAIPVPVPIPNPESLFPLQQSKVYGPQTFELGLVLGGTVSAGCYTAGALDFLMQALDAWHLAKDPHSDAPNPPSQSRHDVKIRIATGASGGSICGTVLMAAADRKFTSITNPPPAPISGASNTDNPFWNVWVEGPDISTLTATDDGVTGGNPVPSFLNSNPVDVTGNYVVNFAGTAAYNYRPYFENPRRLIVTLSNLRGLPYRIDVNNSPDPNLPGSCFVEHNDYARIAVPDSSAPVPVNGIVCPFPTKRPDEFWIDPTIAPAGDTVGWDVAKQYALGSAAFPLGLKTRQLSRPWSHYLYRPFVDPGDTSTGPLVRWLIPDWSLLGNNQAAYDFTTVDGGVFNNDPINLARTWLTGLNGHNPRDPKLADRAILMIDPLASQSDDSCATDIPHVDMMGALFPMVQGAISGARYLTSDLALMADPTVFSRFQLVPSDPVNKRFADQAIISSRLIACAGFFSRDFRVHDYMLGRVNMQAYLRTEFVLHQKNDLFDKWSDADRNRWAVDANGQRVTDTSNITDFFLPIIPDVTLAPFSTDINSGLPWNLVSLPGQFDPGPPSDMLKVRVQAVVDNVLKQEIKGIFGWLARVAAEGTITQSITDYLMQTLNNSLSQMGIEILSQEDMPEP